MKKRIIFALSIIFVIALLPVFMPRFVHAEAEGITVPDFSMDAGAAVRIASGDETGEDSGIRYSFTLAASEYEALISSKTVSSVKFGVFIAAASYNVAGKEIADETHISGANAIYYWKVSETENGDDVFNVTPTAGMRRIICAEGDAMKVDGEGKAHFYGSVVEMKDANLCREYVGVGYIKFVVNGETHYKFAAANDNVRTMDQIARIAYARDEQHRAQLVKIYLSKTARDCVVTTEPTAIADLVETGENQALVTAGIADDYSVMNYSLYGETFGDEIPVASQAGTYTVYYKAKSLTSFDRDSAVKTLTVKIAEPQTSVVTLKAATITEKKENGKVVGYSGTYDYKGLGEYKVGDTLAFKFKGQNIPNVGLFVNKNGVNPIGGGTENTGIFLQTSGHGAVTYNKRLYITGPYLVDAGGAEYYSSISGFAYREWLGSNKELGVDVSYEVDGGRFSHFGLEMLDENTDYIYRITTSETGTASTVNIRFTLHTVTGGEETLVADVIKTVAHFQTSLANRYAVAYGTGDFYSKNENVYTGKTIKFETVREVVEENELTLQPAAVIETKKDGVHVGFGGTYDYKGLGEYKVGDVLEFTFKGQNIPNVGLFVNKNGVNPIGGGKENTGLFVQTSGHGAVTYNKRLYITGPYLVDAGGPEYYSDIAGFKYNTWLGANKEMGVDVSYAVDGGRYSRFGIEMLDENTNYVYRIESSDGTDKQVTLKFILYTVNENGERTEYANFVKVVTHLLPSLENRYAVVYGAGDFYSKNSNIYTGKPITFSYEVKKAA